MLLLFAFREEYLVVFDNIEGGACMRVAKMAHILQSKFESRRVRGWMFGCLDSSLCHGFWETGQRCLSHQPEYSPKPWLLTATFEPYTKARTKLTRLWLSNCYQCTQRMGVPSSSYNFSQKIPPPIPSLLSSNICLKEGLEHWHPYPGGRKREPLFD